MPTPPLRAIAKLDDPYGERLLIFEADPFARVHAVPSGYELLPGRTASFALRSALARDHDGLSALFERVFECSPYESADAMLDALDDAVGFSFACDDALPSRAKILVARPLSPSARQRPAAKAATKLPQREVAPLAWFGIELVRPGGGPVALVRCTIEIPNGEVRSLLSDARGQVRLDGIPPGDCKVCLPHHAADAWRAPVPSAPAQTRRESMHLVQQGESLTRIAHLYGIGRWQELWEHGANAPLRARRTSPHVLLPGDRVHIPATPTHQVTLPTDAMHRIVIDEAEVELCVRLQDRAKRPLANLAYRLVARGPSHHIERPGSAPTDAQGLLRERVPTGVETIVVIVERPRLRLELLIDQLDPTLDADKETVIHSGADARLHALGFSRGALRERVATFQRTRLRQPSASGVLDAATCRALEREYGV